MNYIYNLNLFSLLAISAFIIIILVNTYFISYEIKIFNNNIIPLRIAHSHNDYLRNIPVFDALSNGFCSIEADIYFRKNDLYLGHNTPSNKLFKDVYLTPLKKIISVNKNGMIYKNTNKLQLCKYVDLIIDFKDDDSYPAWNLLEKYLKEYNIFQCYNNHYIVKDGPIRIILSGNHPKISDILKVKHCSVVDIKYDDLKNGNYTMEEKNIIGQINTQWKRGWEMDDKYVKNIVKMSKTNGINASVRFWGIKEYNTNFLFKMWDFLLKNGVDRIGTDNLTLLKIYLLN